MPNFKELDVSDLYPRLLAWAEPFLGVVDRYRELSQVTVILDQMDARAAFVASESAAKGREVHCFESDDHVLSIHKSLLNTTLTDTKHENINLILPKTFRPPEDRHETLTALEERLGRRVGRGTAGVCLFCNRPGYSWTVHAHRYPFRLHLPLYASQPNYFFWEFEDRCEYVCMRAGQAYLVRTDIPHSTYNGGADLRVHLVLDVQ